MRKRRVQDGSVVEWHKDLSFVLPHSFGKALPEVTSVEEGAPVPAQAEGRAAGGAQQQPAQPQRKRAGKYAVKRPGDTASSRGPPVCSP